MTRIFSGVQPTGNLHLGNYLGAIKQWVDLQHQHESIFCIVDLHAITVPQDPAELRDNTLAMAAAYIAAGIDPQKSIIYHQSAVRQHTELAWLLSCHTPLGWLNRMTQFKEKAGKKKEQAALGLYSYPVLMAADVLLFDTTHVPVGDDQKQHIELAREIAISMNNRYSADLLTVPEPMITATATRVMSLRDGSKKMSKSDISEASRINLTDDADMIAQKFRKAKADMDFDGIYYDKDNRPEISNLLTIYAALQNKTLEQAQAEVGHMSNAEFKAALSDVATDKLVPISDEMNRLLDDRAHLESILKEGAEKASKIAEEKIKHVKETLGFLA